MRHKTVVFLLLLALSTALIGNTRPANAAIFSAPTSLPNPDPNDNVFPKLLQLQNGTVWMVWEKIIPAVGGSIYLMTNNGYGWSGASAIVNGNYDNISPSIAQLNNGTIILVWSRGTTGNFNSYQIYTRSYTNGGWSAQAPLVTVSPSNFDPVLLKTSDGSIWMVWSRSSTANGNGDLYYKIFRNGSWGAETIIPTASMPSFEEKLPSIAQAADGSIFIVYESNIAGVAQLYQTKYGGSAWTTSSLLTSTVDSDKWPSITMDRSGTLWLFWAREIPNGTSSPPNPTPLYQWDIYYKFSTNNGTSWTTDTSLFNIISTDEQHPAAFQGPDKTVWVVYDSCCNSPGNPYGNPNLFVTKSGVILAHDLAVTGIAVSPGPRPRLGENVTITVEVTDAGDYPETSTLSLYINNALLGNKSVTVNSSGKSTASFCWPSKGHTPATYSAKAVISQVSREFVTQNNNQTGSFSLTFRGDVDRDGEVGLSDLSSIGARFGAAAGSPNFAAAADLNNDGRIDLYDLIICSADFSKTLS